MGWNSIRNQGIDHDIKFSEIKWQTPVMFIGNHFHRVLCLIQPTSAINVLHGCFSYHLNMLHDHILETASVVTGSLHTVSWPVYFQHLLQP